MFLYSIFFWKGRMFLYRKIKCNVLIKKKCGYYAFYTTYINFDNNNNNQHLLGEARIALREHSCWCPQQVFYKFTSISEKWWVFWYDGNTLWSSLSFSDFLFNDALNSWKYRRRTIFLDKIKYVFYRSRAFCS